VDVHVDVDMCESVDVYDDGNADVDGDVGVYMWMRMRMWM